MRAKIDLDASGKTFASGLLVEIVGALAGLRDGELLRLHGNAALAADLDLWSRLTGNAIVDSSAGAFVIRKGIVAAAPEDAQPVGERLWLYSNFDCNLACDYCCVRSSPSAERRALGLDAVRAIAHQAPSAGVREIFVTGGEPFLLEDIGAMIAACVEAAPTTVLTNGMLFLGRRREALAALPRDRLVLQVSLDSPTPDRHDLHRGRGTWDKAWRGASVAREAGFRVRFAATVASDDEEATMVSFFETEGIALRDRVVRRVALRGFAESGIALSRRDLVPEVTITARGVYWHPVGATDDDFFVTADALPLARAIEAVALAWQEEQRFATALASVFHCA